MQYSVKETSNHSARRSQEAPHVGPMSATKQPTSKHGQVNPSFIIILQTRSLVCRHPYRPFLPIEQDFKAIQRHGDAIQSHSEPFRGHPIESPTYSPSDGRLQASSLRRVCDVCTIHTLHPPAAAEMLECWRDVERIHLTLAGWLYEQTSLTAVIGNSVVAVTLAA